MNFFLDRSNFNQLNTQEKQNLVNQLVKLNLQLTPEEINYLTDNNRGAYFENRNRTSDWVTDYEFDFMNDDEKKVHIQYTRNLTKNALSKLSEELQKEFIDSCMKSFRELNKEEFSLLKNDEIKKYYVDSKIKSNRLTSLEPYELVYVDEDYQIKFINSLLRNGMVPKEELIRVLKPEALRFFERYKNINEVKSIVRSEIRKILK
jgi:hypothetical protein